MDVRRLNTSKNILFMTLFVLLISVGLYILNWHKQPSIVTGIIKNSHPGRGLISGDGWHTR